MFEKVLVANRGEIAVRVMHACQELDIDTVAIYSDPDRNAGHVRQADEAYNVGPARAAESYLDQDTILETADRAAADAIHPGYGFLAENHEFARAVEHADDLTWIGPPSDAMERLGEKPSARTLMQAADVPIVPGTTEPATGPDAVEAFGDEYGYPIAIKAAGGGGGRGMKIVDTPDEIQDQFESAQREGDAYFDNPEVYLERYLENPKHIEIQVIADHHGNVRHLGERDCSLQRRHQKIIEEAPSPSITPSLRERMGEAARRGVTDADYTNAGTVEFLVEDHEYYFLEVNTRIQVEHTVTEAITGIDIVKWQIRVAAGEELSFTQDDVTHTGHAIEYRINAENPANNFRPTPGTLTTYDPPGGIGVRVDDAVRQDDTISGDYDSMIAKLIVTGADRQEAIARSRRALREFMADGVHTTIPFHRLMLDDDVFLSGEHTTKYLDTRLDPTDLAQAVDRWGPTTLDTDTPEHVERTFTVEVNGKRFEVALEEQNPPAGQPTQTSANRTNTTQTAAQAPEPTAETVDADGEVVTAEMQGTILEVNVEPGDTVDAGDVLCVLEAMKMENDILAARPGTVTDVHIAEGDTVNMGDVLVVIE